MKYIPKYIPNEVLLLLDIWKSISSNIFLKKLYFAGSVEFRGKVSLEVNLKKYHWILKSAYKVFDK